jgi:hypothetical protein
VSTSSRSVDWHPLPLASRHRLHDGEVRPHFSIDLPAPFAAVAPPRVNEPGGGFTQAQIEQMLVHLAIRLRVPHFLESRTP